MDRLSSAMFHRHAKDFRGALLELSDTQEALRTRLPTGLTIPGEVLACQAIEMALKGCLRGHGWCLEHVRGRAQQRRGKNVGHNISRAYKLLRGCMPPPEIPDHEENEAVIAVLGEAWKQRDLPYMPQGVRRGVAGDQIVRVCNRIVDATDAFCWQQEHVHESVHLAPPCPVSPARACGCPIPDRPSEDQP